MEELDTHDGGDLAPETVNHPQHYGGDTVYEAIKIIEAHQLGFHLGNSVKYILRSGKKNKDRELEDLKKAEWYLHRRMKQLELGVDVVPPEKSVDLRWDPAGPQLDETVILEWDQGKNVWEETTIEEMNARLLELNQGATYQMRWRNRT